MKEEVVDEEELKQEEIKEQYYDNLTKSYNSHLETIKYFRKPINILIKEERQKINQLYKNVNPIQNICNADGLITQLKDLNVSTITMFFPFNCDIINLSLISKYICKTCNVIGCNGKCEPFDPTTVTNNKKRRGKQKKNGDSNNCTCTIKIDGISSRIPLKKLKQFDNQYSYYFNFKNHEQTIPYFSKLKNKKDREKILKPRIIKIYQNGKIAILGLKTLEQGYTIAQEIVDVLNNIMIKEPTLTQKTTEITETTETKTTETTTETTETIETTDTKSISLLRNSLDDTILYDIHVINATYYIDFELDRAYYMNYLLINTVQENNVIIVQMHIPLFHKILLNIDNKFNGKFGKCMCTRECNGKGCGKGNGIVNRLLLMYSKVVALVLWVRDIEQLDDCYHFINSF